MKPNDNNRNSSSNVAIVVAIFLMASAALAVAVMTQHQALAAKTIPHNLKSGGAVPLIPIDTGNSKLDKNIHTFYNCFSKFSHPDPNAKEVKNCLQRFSEINDPQQQQQEQQEEQQQK